MIDWKKPDCKQNMHTKNKCIEAYEIKMFGKMGWGFITIILLLTAFIVIRGEAIERMVNHNLNIISRVVPAKDYMGNPIDKKLVHERQLELDEAVWNETEKVKDNMVGYDVLAAFMLILYLGYQVHCFRFCLNRIAMYRNNQFTYSVGKCIDKDRTRYDRHRFCVTLLVGDEKIKVENEVTEDMYRKATFDTNFIITHLTDLKDDSKDADEIDQIVEVY